MNDNPTIHPVPGATPDPRGTGVHFGVFSDHAQAVEVCLFDRAHGAPEVARIPLHRHQDRLWHAFVPGIGPGQLYGFRAHGPYAPFMGWRYNHHKLLLDPYARAVVGSIDWSGPVYGFVPGTPEEDLPFDPRDSAAYVPKSMVIDSGFDWGEERPLRVPWRDTVIYECHVRGMTMLHPEVPPALRGTFLGLVCPPILDHLRTLGVTAVELLPIHHALTSSRLAELGLVNYWGYDPIALFAPDARFATRSDGPPGRQVDEFRQMVRRFHEAGIEVILDVVFNHTAEWGRLGPTLCLRGLDNATYYRLSARHPHKYEDFTGCGNALNLAHARTLRLVMDCMRYWVMQMHVDGFRLDLATTLARGRHELEAEGPFLAAVQQDPILSQIKIIAEPWDPGPSGYQLGRFPAGWPEWNDRFRDSIRRFWRGDPGQVAEVASRLAGSSDLFHEKDDTPLSSVNYVAAHDGFTLCDLVTYESRHNRENGEQNADGHAVNHARNWGVEGPTDDPPIVRLRRRIMHNLAAMPLLAQGVPMLLGGDELNRTQRGNNNAYCQDNAVSWLDWDLDAARRDTSAFVSRLIELRKAHSALRSTRFLRGEAMCNCGIKDVTWFRPDGHELVQADWLDVHRHTLGMMLHAHDQQVCTDGSAPHEAALPDTLLVLMNASEQATPWNLPALPVPGIWHRLVNTLRPVIEPRVVRRPQLRVSRHTLVLLHYVAEQPTA